MQVSKLLQQFDEFWHRAAAEEWDRVGLTVGNPESDVTRILVSVDLTEAVIEEAIASGVHLILTHHPLLLRGVESVTEDQLKGNLIAKLIKADIATFSAHTNADVQTDGATTELAKLLGLGKLEPLIPSAAGFGLGLLGTLPNPITLQEFASLVSKQLPKTARRVAFSGAAGRIISRVALCSGAGDSLLPQVIKSDADVFVTSDLRHHPALDAIETPRPGGKLSLVDVSHWASESLWVRSAISRLSTLTGIEVIASLISTDPWTEEV